jgi:hypothetical protein
MTEAEILRELAVSGEVFVITKSKTFNSAGEEIPFTISDAMKRVVEDVDAKIIKCKPPINPKIMNYYGEEIDFDYNAEDV